MLLMLVPPVPVGSLLPMLEVLVIHVGRVPCLQPTSIDFVLARIPIVIILVIWIVNPSLPFFFFMPLVLVLWCGHSKRAQGRQQCSCEKQRGNVFISTMHSFSSKWPTRMISSPSGLEAKIAYVSIECAF